MGKFVLDEKGQEYVGYLEACEEYGTEPLDYAEYFVGFLSLRRQYTRDRG